MRRTLAPLLVAICGSVLLSGCGLNRDTELEEKLQRAEQAAQRAEIAQKKAELAAQKAVTYVEHKSFNGPEEPSQAELDMDKASQDPNSAKYNPGANISNDPNIGG